MYGQQASSSLAMKQEVKQTGTTLFSRDMNQVDHKMKHKLTILRPFLKVV